MFKAAKKDRISTQIINQIREAILQGEITPGQSLPPEKELVAQFGVSKHTLREALRTLEGMGLISIRRGAGGGPVVTEVEMETTKDFMASFLHFQNVSLHDLSEVRKIIEPYLARHAAETFTEADKQDLLRLHEKCQEIHRRDQSLIGAQVEIEFHVLLARKTGNPVLILILDFVNSLLAKTKKQFGPDNQFAEHVLEDHQKIIDAIIQKDPDAASTIMLRHIVAVEEELYQLEVSQHYEKGRTVLESGSENDKIHLE
ncbi:FadR/GntR family transcriptional regulator [Desulfovibrio inopinatus]|uniref:FadR/GntR family transcriptional regulator n=1 Tax=Desulfovibrio inopinatus TaxID=102109 RepID=UPI000421F452|nr:FadR/GntR family transcriptional regulator [Desulfovibrio inopinatus]